MVAGVAKGSTFGGILFMTREGLDYDVYCTLYWPSNAPAGLDELSSSTPEEEVRYTFTIRAPQRLASSSPTRCRSYNSRMNSAQKLLKSKWDSELALILADSEAPEDIHTHTHTE
eukprot:2054980-Amphidinium_carterae.3